MIGEAHETLGKGGKTDENEPGKEKTRDEVEMLEHENEVRAYPLRGAFCPDKRGKGFWANNFFR